VLFIPNHRFWTFPAIHCDVNLWTSLTDSLGLAQSLLLARGKGAGATSATAEGRPRCSESLDQSLMKGGPSPRMRGFGQPRKTDLQTFCCFLRGEENDDRRSGFRKRRARLNIHRTYLQSLATGGTFDEPRDRYRCEFLIRYLFLKETWWA
jgi:hypothetical protein